MSDNYYNEIANGYNELYMEEQSKKCDFIFQKYDFSKLIQKRELTILDIGCGTGLSSLFLLKHLNKLNQKSNELKIINLIMLDPAQKLLKQINIDENEFQFDLKIQIINESAENLNKVINSKEIDFIFSLTALQNANNINNSIKNIKTILDQNKKSHFIISILYRGIEEKIDLLNKQFKLLNYKKQFSDNKDIYYLS